MRRTVIAALMVGFGVMCIPIAGAAEETPTYNAEVGSILLDNCASCHRPNQIAPMSLLSYKDTRPWARAIKAKVEARPAKCLRGLLIPALASSPTTRA